MMMPDRVTVVEVGPRDGLQNETKPIPTERKNAFIARLVSAGLKHLEVTSFVSPGVIPQLADAEQVVAALPLAPGVTFSALVPNAKGLERAIAAGVKRVAVFTAASDTFTQKNINMAVEESLKAYRPVVEAAVGAGLTVRGYVSTAFVCPYEGEIPKERVRSVAERLIAMGVDQVAISDTVGAASPRDVTNTVGHVLLTVPRKRVALHFHDTYGTAVANVYAGLQLGVDTYDAAAGGLGGCPFAPGAAGNLATEDLIYLLDRLGIESGVDIARTLEAAEIVTDVLGRQPVSRQWRRMRGK